MGFAVVEVQKTGRPVEFRNERCHDGVETCAARGAYLRYAPSVLWGRVGLANDKRARRDHRDEHTFAWSGALHGC